MFRQDIRDGVPGGFDGRPPAFRGPNVANIPPPQFRQMPRGVLTAIEEDSVAETDTTTPMTMAGTTAGGRTARRQAEHWEQLGNLEQLFKQGFIDQRDYDERKKQLIDQLTGTKTHRRGQGATTMRSMTRSSLTRSSLTRSSVSTSRRRSRRRRRDSGLLPVVVPRGPPDFFDLPSERAVKHIFNYAKRQWEKEDVFVRVDPTPFASGGLRLVYHMQVYGSAEEAAATGNGKAVADQDPARNSSTAGSSDSAAQPRIRSLVDGDPASSTSARASIDSAGVADEDVRTAGTRNPDGHQLPGKTAVPLSTNVPDMPAVLLPVPADDGAGADVSADARVGPATPRECEDADASPLPSARAVGRAVRSASDGSVEGVDPTSYSAAAPTPPFTGAVSGGGGGGRSTSYVSGGSGSETVGGEGDRAAVLLGPGGQPQPRGAAAFGAGMLPPVRGSRGVLPAPVLTRHRASADAAALADAAEAAGYHGGREPVAVVAGVAGGCGAGDEDAVTGNAHEHASAAGAGGSGDGDRRQQAAAAGGGGGGGGGEGAVAQWPRPGVLGMAGAAGPRRDGDAEAYVPAVSRKLPRAPAGVGAASGGGGGGAFGGRGVDPRTGQSGTLVTGVPGRGEGGACSVPGLATIPTGATWVAKVGMGEVPDVDTYFRDVEMQLHCAAFASSYNSYLPPRTVQFAPCFVLQLVERPGAVFVHAEPHIRGRYQKFNNNAGWVEGDEEAQRNTPQAFSHFTFEASRCRILVVDIQGVGDCYTDPQVHTLNERGFGLGNRGTRGIENFLTTHRCNSICSFLRLAPVNPKSAAQDKGTMPAQPVMSSTRINPVRVDQEDAYARTPHLVGFMERAGIPAGRSPDQAARGQVAEGQPLLAAEHASANIPYTHGRVVDPGRGPSQEPHGADKAGTRCMCTLL